MNNSVTETESRLPSPLLKASEAADYLKVSKATLNKLRRQGELTPTYICSDARYHQADLDDFIHSRRQPHGGTGR